ncbi:MAG TPA: sigma-54 dependent transcriptional regulator [Candidatus Angelobacter sp.]|nr:sigma-54 dependent transcriptional regulator [Candidatus Angelobacter sp.]
MASAMRAVSRQDYSPSGLSLLIVDDDNWMRESCKSLAEKMGFVVQTADSAVAGLMQLATFPAHVVLLDLRQAEAETLQLLARIKRLQPSAELIVVGSQGKYEVPAPALKSSIFEFLRKPFNAEDFKGVLERIAAYLHVRGESAGSGSYSNGNGFTSFVSQSPEMQKLLRIVSKVGSSRQPVLIVGENGTGKEKLARAIHVAGALPGAGFVPVDCSSPTRALIEAELFAMERPGGSTIFLDEVSELPLELQGKLVRALQDREVRVPGRSLPLPFDVRLIASTRVDLEPMSRMGTFRRDLYLRLNVVSLRLPPLRERREDIQLLARHILGRVSAETGKSYSISEEAMRLLLSHEWPGNVTELEGSIQRAVTLSSSPVLQPEDFPSYGPSSSNGSGSGLSSKLTEIIPLAELEKKTILMTLERLNGDKMATARLLGIGKTTLYRKLREYGIADRWVARPAGQ